MAVGNLLLTGGLRSVTSSWTPPTLSYPKSVSGYRLAYHDMTVGASLVSTQRIGFLPKGNIRTLASGVTWRHNMGLVDVHGNAYWWGNGAFHFTVSADAMRASANNKLTHIPLSGTTDMSIGHSHVLLLRNDGTVWGYGVATQGELGVTTAERRVPYIAPVQITGLTGITQILAGNGVSYALRNDGTLWSWGRGAPRSGRSSTASSATPTQVTGISSVTRLPRSNNGNMLVWATGSSGAGAYGWGWNTYGELGITSAGAVVTDTYNLPTHIPTLTTLAVTDFAFGEIWALGLTGSGNLYAWGDNTSRTLGIGITPWPEPVGEIYTQPIIKLLEPPTYVMNNVLSVAAGSTASIVARGTGVAWGCGYNPQLELGPFRQSSTNSYAGTGTFQPFLNGSSLDSDRARRTLAAIRDATFTQMVDQMGLVSYGDNTFGQTGWDPSANDIPWVGLNNMNFPQTAETQHTLSGNNTFDLKDGTVYRVTVSTYDEKGVIIPPDGIASGLTLSAPQAPAPVASSPSAGTINVSWAAPYSQAPITSYLAQYRPSGTSTWFTVPGFPSLSTSFSLSGQMNGQAITVQVRADASAGLFSAWGSAEATPHAVPLRPSTPTAIQIPGVGVDLSWSYPSNYAEFTLEGFVAQYRRVGDAAWQTASHNTHSPYPVYRVAQYFEGGQYEFRVAGISPSGTGTYSFTSTPIQILEYPMQPERVQLVTSMETVLELRWTPPTRGHFDNYRIRHRQLGDPTWTALTLAPNKARWLLKDVLRDVVYEVEILTQNSVGNSDPVVKYGVVRRADVPTITFLGRKLLAEVPDPHSARLNMPNAVKPIITQGGFFLPTQAIDDMEASWQLTWNSLAKRYVDQLEPLQGAGTVTITDPLELLTFGYVDSIDYQGIPGTYDDETGEPLYSVNMDFKVIRMELPPIVTGLPDGEHAHGSNFGISRMGAPPVTLTVANPQYSGYAEKGWLLSRGGDMVPWGDLVPPSGDEWSRIPRVASTGVFGSPFPAAWLTVDAALAPPNRGSVYAAFMALGAMEHPQMVSGVDANEIPLVDVDSLGVSTAPGAYYGYCKVRDRFEMDTPLGRQQTTSTIAWVDVPSADLLLLGSIYNLEPQTVVGVSSYTQEYAVVTAYASDLPSVVSLTQQRDSLGFKLPQRGLYVRQDVVLLDHNNQTIQRTYLPIQEVYSASSLRATPYWYNQPVGTFTDLAPDYRAWVQAGNHYGPGTTLIADMATLFGWLDEGFFGFPGFDAEFSKWAPGYAGPYERVLFGTVDPKAGSNSWLVYAFGRKIIAEFWRGKTLLATRMLDCGNIIDLPVGDERFLVGLGYDWEVGRVSLGVNIKGTQSGHRFASWTVPELVGFGYQEATINIGGGTLVEREGITMTKTAWAWVHPADHSFSREQFLSPGLMATLMEYVP